MTIPQTNGRKSIDSILPFNCGLLDKRQLKQLSTSQNSLLVVQLASLILKSIPMHYEVWTSEKLGD